MTARLIVSEVAVYARVASARMRRARTVLIGAARRRGAVRASWTITLLAGLFLLL